MSQLTTTFAGKICFHLFSFGIKLNKNLRVVKRKKKTQAKDSCLLSVVRRIQLPVGVILFFTPDTTGSSVSRNALL